MGVPFIVIRRIDNVTIGRLLEIVGQRRPSQYTSKDHIEWLNKIETEIYNDVFLTHEENSTEFNGYEENVDRDTKLLAESPYDSLYVDYLFSMIDYNNGEMQRYNQSASMYNETLSAYKSWYNRLHMPIQPKQIFYRAKNEYPRGNDPLNQRG